MKKLFLVFLLMFGSLAMAQTIQAPGGVNFGNSNLFLVTSGYGAPAASCRSVEIYVQLDANNGSNIWQCVNGQYQQQGVGASTGNGLVVLSNSATLNSPILVSPSLGSATATNMAVTGLTAGNCVQAGAGGELMTVSGPCGSGGGSGGSGVVSTGLVNQIAVYPSNGTTVQGASLLPTSAIPALTGDLAGTAGSSQVNVIGINGVNLAGLASGLIKNTTTTGQPSIAQAGIDYVAPNGSITGTAGNVTGVVAISNGGTGLSVAPAPGQLLVGNTAGSYSIEPLVGDVTVTSDGTVTNIGINSAKIPANAAALASNSQSQLVAAHLAGNGAAITTGPSSTNIGDLVIFANNNGELADANVAYSKLVTVDNPVFTATVSAPNILDSSLVAGNCVQAAADGQLVTVNAPCGSGGGGLNNPMTSAGDMIVGGTNGTPSRLAASTAATTAVLTANNGTVAWAPSTGTGSPVFANSATLSNPIINAAIENNSNLNNATLNSPVINNPTFKGLDLGAVTVDSLNGLTLSQFGKANIALGNSMAGSGNYNIAIGNNTLKSLTNGSSNLAVGTFALLYMASGSNNIAIGSDAGSNTANGATNSGSIGSIYIGAEAMGQNNLDNNEIVIGENAVGHGSNTVTVGSTAITDSYISGNADISGHLNQSAANNYAGVCTMSNTNSCSFTIAAVYQTAAVCITNAQGSNPIAAACTVNGNTVTITAATNNNETWGAILVGNPN